MALAWEFDEELVFTESEDEDEANRKESKKFLDGIPDDLVERFIWPKLLLPPPQDDTGKYLRTLNRAEHAAHIRVMLNLRGVCRAWRQWVGAHEDWTYGVVNYIENFLAYDRYSSSDDDEGYDSDREPSCWKGVD